jgi:hypothetical protein
MLRRPAAYVMFDGDATAMNHVTGAGLFTSLAFPACWIANSGFYRQAPQEEDGNATQVPCNRAAVAYTGAHPDWQQRVRNSVLSRRARTPGRKDSLGYVEEFITNLAGDG